MFQMTVSGSFYFSYFWNYMDWFRGIMLYFYIIGNWLGEMSEYSNSIFSLVVFVSFTRGISYFRLFKFTRYLINLLFQVISDIRGFIILLAYSTVAFCFLFIVLNRNSNACDFETDPECEVVETTFSSYLMGSYNLVLGNFDSEAEYNLIEYTCLTFALLINPIIMLNLLISIIGDTYDRVQSDNLSADMKETLDMIQEVENMMFFRRNKGKKMFFQECTEYEKTDQEAGWEGKLRALEGTINKIQEKNTENHGVLMKKLKNQDRVIEIITEKIDSIMRKLQNKDGKDKPNDKKPKITEKKES